MIFIKYSLFNNLLKNFNNKNLLKLLNIVNEMLNLHILMLLISYDIYMPHSFLHFNIILYNFII